MQNQTNRPLRPILILVFLTHLAALIHGAVVQAEKSSTDLLETRAWAQAEMKSQIGRWVADNSAYRSDAEPYEAYGLVWAWTKGEKSLVGRLFPIRDGRDLADVWDFRMIWHPGKQALWLSQIGTNGTIGEGAITRIGEHATEAIQTFFTPDGSSFQVGHRDELRGDQRHVRSFDVDQKGDWQPRRAYVWSHQPAAELVPVHSDKGPLNSAYAPLEWLIGEWQAEFRPHGQGSAAPTMAFEWGSARHAFIKMTGTMPSADGGLEPEYEHTLVWHPVDRRFVFLGVYHSAGGKVMEDGDVTLLEGGQVRLNMRVHYPAGATLPFSEGVKAGATGHTYEFRRTFRPEGKDGLRGTFRLRRGEQWENPHPRLLEGAGYPWRRVDG